MQLVGRAESALSLGDGESLPLVVELFQQCSEVWVWVWIKGMLVFTQGWSFVR